MPDNDENDVDDDDDERKDRKRRKKKRDKQPGGKKTAGANIYTMKSHGPYDYRSTPPNEGLGRGRRRKGRLDGGGAKCNVDYRPLGRDSRRSKRDGRTQFPELRRVAIALTSSEAFLMERRLVSSSEWILAKFRAVVAASVRKVSSDTKTSGHSTDGGDDDDDSRCCILSVATSPRSSFAKGFLYTTP